MAVGSVYSTTTALRLMKEVWPAQFDVLAYDRATFYPLIKNYGAVGNKLHIPLMANLARFTPVAAAFDNLTFSANTETEAVLSAVTLSVPVQIEKNVLVRQAEAGENVYRDAAAASLAEGIDAACLTDVSALVANQPAGDGAAKLDKAK